MRRTALLAAACMLGMAHAETAFARPSAGFYATLHGGFNFLEDSDLELAITGGPTFEGELEFFTGWAAGGALGYRWDNGVSLESELTYRENDFKRQELMGSPEDIDGDLSSIAGMLNARYELDTGGPVTPFIGAGLGIAWLTVNANPDTPDAFKDCAAEFAYQLIAGANYELSPQLLLGLELRYFGTASPTFHEGGINPTVDYHSEDIFLTMSYQLQ